MPDDLRQYLLHQLRWDEDVTTAELFRAFNDADPLRQALRDPSDHLIQRIYACTGSGASRPVIRDVLVALAEETRTDA